tara:strand:+ start:799 stop:1149 length:351 start_codon:yes stop_codon:yes gene_type:complete
MVQEIYDQLPSEIKNLFSYEDIHELIFIGGPRIKVIKNFCKGMLDRKDLTADECVAVSRVSLARTLVLEKGASGEKELEQRFEEMYDFADRLMQRDPKKIMEELGRAVEKQKIKNN